jgi:dTMP kinase
MYVAIEGIDTAGKSTQIELLKSDFKDAVFTKEPFSKEIREIILESGLESKRAELMLFLADRGEHITKIIKPNLDKEIFSDRSLISGIAYAMLNFDLKFLIGLNLFATEETLPQKVVLLWLDIDKLEERLSKKSQDKIEQRGVNYLFDIQSKMLEVLRELKIDTEVINASNPPHEINIKIKDFLRR